MTDEKTCPDCGTPLVSYCLNCKKQRLLRVCVICGTFTVMFCMACKSAYIEVNKEITIKEDKNERK